MERLSSLAQASYHVGTKVAVVAAYGVGVVGAYAVQAADGATTVMSNATLPGEEAWCGGSQKECNVIALAGFSVGAFLTVATVAGVGIGLTVRQLCSRYKHYRESIFARHFSEDRAKEAAKGYGIINDESSVTEAAYEDFSAGKTENPKDYREELLHSVTEDATMPPLDLPKRVSFSV